jgi:predicted dinucleotide-binding enzyme
MKIGIIGAGHIGSTLADHLASAGHEVAIANSREPQTLSALADQINGKFATQRVRATTAADAARSGDVVILAVPFGRFTDLPAAEFAGKTVVDATNYHPERDGNVAELDHHDRTSSQLIQDRLARARVVKAFNAMRWDHLRDYGREGGTPYRYGIPVAGDDDDAKRTVLTLVSDIGFDPVNAGGLAEGGRKFEPGADVYTADLRADELQERVGIVPL